MRIISGEWKGRKLVSFDEKHIRPTTDRVKETIFNVLQSSWDGAQVLDLFSGTGSLGLEALSRGAREVVFVERHDRSLAILKKNLQLFETGGREKIVRSEVVKFLLGYHGEPFEIVLADPPFTEKMGHEVMQALSQSEVYGPETIIVIEVAKKERLDEVYGRLRRIDTRNFGDKLAAFFNCSASQEAQK